MMRRVTAIDEAMSGRSARMETVRKRVSEFEGEEAVRQAAWEKLNERREAVAAVIDAKPGAEVLAGIPESKLVITIEDTVVIVIGIGDIRDTIIVVIGRD